MRLRDVLRRLTRWPEINAQAERHAAALRAESRALDEMRRLDERRTGERRGARRLVPVHHPRAK